MAYESADNIDKYKRKGERILHSEWNAVARAATQDRTMAFGGADESSFAQAQQKNSKRSWVKIWSDVDVAPYSIFGITAGQANNEEVAKLQLGVHGFVEGGSLGVMLTNGSEPVIANQWNWAHIIDPWEPTLLRTATAIPVGHQCGPMFDDVVVSYDDRYGLVALSPRDSDLRQYFVATREPCGIIGVLTTHLEAFDPATRTLGYARCRAYYRQEVSGGFGGQIIDPARNPATGGLLYEFGVYNLCLEEFPVGTWIKAHDVQGIGLVASPCKERVSASSSSFSVPSEPSVPSESQPPSESSVSSSSPPTSESSASECQRCFTVPIAFMLDPDTCEIVPTTWKTICIDANGCITETESGSEGSI